MTKRLNKLGVMGVIGLAIAPAQANLLLARQTMRRRRVAETNALLKRRIGNRTGRVQPSVSATFFLPSVPSAFQAIAPRLRTGANL